LKRFDYIALAEDIAALSSKLAGEALYEKKIGNDLDLRNRVVAGLLLKISSSFRALIADAKVLRGESMHHLKTMTEAFIYLVVVVEDASDRTARAVFAEALHSRIIYLEKNPEYADDGAEIRDLHQLLTRLTEGGVRRIGVKPLEQVADAHSRALGRWYAHTYRLACEPAHISDLVDFMPATEPEKTVLSHEERAAARRCYMALDHGITIMLSLGGRLQEAGMLALADPMKAFRARLEKIRTVRPAREQG
jgi:hypothetical protein